MSSYQDPNAAPALVATTTGATNAALAFASRAANAVGYAICNPDPTVLIYVQERPSGDATVPTASQVIAAPSMIVQPYQTGVSGCRAGKVYIASVSVINASVQELRG